ncbi:hypothetical protein M9Y10_031806 [Tritrichomonas musculus]|uniref:Non-specific serine/threonine protein kinase n=1 Tax=Tritrichomonas musculus TaxID=1915356 RepID=A0ABR2GZT7_9EUKA
MNDLVKYLFSSAIPNDKPPKLEDFHIYVHNLQEKIINNFRYSSIELLTPFINLIFIKIYDNSQSEDKQATLSSAICLTALINIFPIDENIHLYQPIIQNLLIPGYRPIIDAGSIVLGCFSHISSQKCDIFLSKLIEDSYSIISSNSNSIESKYTAAIILRQLSHSYPEGFFDITESFFNDFYDQIQNTKNEKIVSFLLLQIMRELFQTDAASIGSNFLECFHEFLIQKTTQVFLKGNIKKMKIQFDILQIILTISPTINECLAKQIYQKCLEGTNSRSQEIVFYSIYIISYLFNKKLIAKDDSIIHQLFKKINNSRRIYWEEKEPILNNLITFFTDEIKIINKMNKIHKSLPKFYSASYSFHLLFSVLQAGKVKDISAILDNIIEYYKSSSIHLPINKVLKVLNRNYNWYECYSAFRRNVISIIRNELSKPINESTSTENIIIALKSIQEIPKFSYMKAIEFKNLVMKLINNKDFELRGLIVATVIHLFIKMPNEIPLDSISDLVDFALNDQVVSVRIKSVKSFDNTTFQYLGQDEIFENFCNFCFDESAEVRKEALKIIKKLKIFDLSIMRRILLSSFDSIKMDVDINIPESSPALIAFPYLIDATEPIIHIYAMSFFNFFHEQLSKRFAESTLLDVNCVYMNCILFKEIDETLIKTISNLYLLCPDIIPIKNILDLFCKILKQNVHPCTKENVLKSFKKIAGKTTITENCTEIFNSLLTVIKKKESKKIVIKALKILGNIGVVNVSSIPIKEPLFFRTSFNDTSCFNQYFLNIYFKFLNDFFDSNSIDSIRIKIVLCFLDIFKANPYEIKNHLEPFLSKYLKFIEKSTSKQIPIFLENLNKLIICAGSYIIPHSIDIFQSLKNHWEFQYTKEVSIIFNQLIISTEGKVDFNLMPMIHDSFEIIRNKDNNDDSAVELFNLFRTIIKYYGDYGNLMIDFLIKVIFNSNYSSNIQHLSLDSIEYVVKEVNIDPYLRKINRCLNNVLKRPENVWRAQATKILEDVRSIQNKIIPKNVICNIYNNQSSKNNSFVENDEIASNRNDDYDQILFYLTIPSNEKANIYQWFDNLCLFLIQSCRSNNILRSMLVLPSIPYFGFEFVFFSIWFTFCQEEKNGIIEKLNLIFSKRFVPSSIMMKFIEIVEFSFHAEIDLAIDIPKVIDACIFFKFFSRALFFLENSPESTVIDGYIEKLIKMNIALDRNEEAFCLAENKLNTDISVWMSLNEWEEALKLINEADNVQVNNLNDNYISEANHLSYDDFSLDSLDELEENISIIDSNLLIQKVQCLASLENWKEIIEMKPFLLQQNKVIQSKLAHFMWMAELFQGTKEEALKMVNLTGGYTVTDCIDKAILYINSGMKQEAQNVIHLGWRFLASSMSSIKENKQEMKSHIFQAEQLHELSEVIDLKDNESLKESIAKSWRSRLKLIKNDFEKQKELFKIRSLVSEIIDPTEFAFNLIQSAKRSSKGIEKLIDLFFPDPKSYNSKFSRIKLIENKDEKINEALLLLNSIQTEKVANSNNIIKRLNNFIGKKMFEEATSYDELDKVSKILSNGQKNFTLLAQVQIIRALLHGDENIALDAINAGLAKCVSDENKAIVLHQLESMTFHFKNSNKVSQAVISKFESVLFKSSHLKYIVHSSVLSLMNRNNNIFNAAHSICLILAKEIPDSIIFDFVSNLEKLKIKLESNPDIKKEIVVFQDLINCLQLKNPFFYSQIMRIINKLDSISHTLYDKTIGELKISLDKIEKNEFENALKILMKVRKSLKKVYVSKYDNEFIKRFNSNSDTILNGLIEKQKLNLDDRLSIQKIIDLTIRNEESIQTIPLSSLDIDLDSKKNWSVSIFGKDMKIMKFHHFVKRLEDGLKIGVIGMNGAKYKFHLIRGEKYHLNQSVQFMTLLNTLTPVQFTQRTMIELKPNLTLIEFFKGKIQLFYLIKKYQKSKGKNTDEEFSSIQQKYSKIDPRKFADEIQTKIGVNDSDNLRKVFLITSKDAEMFIYKTTMFAKSMGTLAGVSYIIGGADNSPHGIIIDKSNAEVTYSNFKVTGLSQKVPFRLTRMIKCAFGPYNENCQFKIMLTKVLKGVRKFSNSLATCLQFALDDEPFIPVKLPKKYLNRYSVYHKNVSFDLGSPSSSIDIDSESDDNYVRKAYKIKRSNSPLIPISSENKLILSSPATESIEYYESRGAIDKFYKRVSGDGRDINIEVDNLIFKAQDFFKFALMPIEFYPWW